MLSRLLPQHRVEVSGLAVGGAFNRRTWFLAACRNIRCHAAIQELAGHQDISTTQRSMHLSPAALDSAIDLLEQGHTRPEIGDILETRIGRTANRNA